MKSSIAPGPLRPAVSRALRAAVLAALAGSLGAPLALLAQTPPLPFEASPVPSMSDPRAADTALEQAKRLADEGPACLSAYLRRVLSERDSRCPI